MVALGTASEEFTLATEEKDPGDRDDGMPTQALPLGPSDAVYDSRGT